MNSNETKNDVCTRISMYDWAFYSWILTNNRNACNPDLLEHVRKVYYDGIKYLMESKKILYESKMNSELLYLDQIEGFYLEMLRNYCLESFFSTIIISRILTEFLVDSIVCISLKKQKEPCNIVKIGKKMNYIRKVYGIKAESFIKTIENIRRIANKYIHQVEKQGELIPRREDLDKKYIELIEKILINASESEIEELKKQLTPCVPSKQFIKEEVLENINKIIQSYVQLVKHILKNDIY